MALAAGLPLPHVIAARQRQARGTDTVTGVLPARNTMPDFSQYGHPSPETLTT
jgi:hypothetical protein